MKSNKPTKAEIEAARKEKAIVKTKIVKK